MTSIFEELHKLAKQKGMPLTEAADLAGVPRTTLWGWRKRLPKTLQALEQIMSVLKPDTPAALAPAPNQPAK